MKVSDYIAGKLVEAGIDSAFLVQGAANNDLIYSIADREDMTYVCPMHEQAAGFMAEGWAKVSGKPGLAIATSGPGGQNLLTCAANFFYDSVPGIFITGQVNSRFMRTDPSLRQVGFQEWPAEEAFRPVTKWAYTVRDPRLIRWALEKALFVSQHGRPGPVLLDIPIDVQRAKVEPGKLESFRPVVPLYLGGLLEQVNQFLDDFGRAERPVVLVGGGARGAERELDTLAEAMSVPFFPTWNALDIVPSNHPWYGGRVGTYGGPGRNFGVQNCDLLLAIGTRLSGRITGGRVESFARGAKRYVVDVDEALLRPHLQQLPFHVSIESDAGQFMRLLEAAIRDRIIHSQWKDYSKAEWAQACFSWRERYDPVPSPLPSTQGIHPYAFARALSEEAPANAVIVYDCGGNAVVMNHAFRTKKGQRYFSNNGNSPMGFAFCAAMGAWFANPERPVICVIGDGGFMMNIQEVQTLLNYGIPVKTFILDNRSYGITKAYQETNFGGRFEASGPNGYKPPEYFDKVVRSFGGALQGQVQSWRIWGGDVRSHINEVLDKKGPVVCVVECPEFRTYEPRISGWNTPIEDMSPLLPREEFRSNMFIEPLPGWKDNDYV